MPEVLTLIRNNNLKVTMGFISRIRVRKSTKTVPVDLFPCGYTHFVQWQRQIHTPFIAPLNCIGSDWNWPARYLGCSMSEEAMGRKCIMLQLRVENSAGEAVPVAQFVLSLPYPSPENDKDEAVFLWLVAKTPPAALVNFGVQEQFSVMPAVLDIAVQVSLAHGYRGRVALHAAKGPNEEENDDLISLYLHCGLTQRVPRTWFFRFPHRPDDGRLFYFTAEDAMTFAKKQDDLR